MVEEINKFVENVELHMNPINAKHYNNTKTSYKYLAMEHIAKGTLDPWEKNIVLKHAATYLALWVGFPLSVLAYTHILADKHHSWLYRLLDPSSHTLCLVLSPYSLYDQIGMGSSNWHKVWRIYLV
jgi:nicotinamide riboside kinase